LGGIDWLWIQIAAALVGLATTIRKYIREWLSAGPVVFDAGGFLPLRCVGIAHVGAIFCLGFPPDLIGWAVRAGLSLFILTLTFGRTQICQNGVWYMISFLPWNEVRDVQWPKEAEVEFHRYGRIAAPIRVAVPKLSRPRVESFLEKVLGELTSAEDASEGASTSAEC